MKKKSEPLPYSPWLSERTKRLIRRMSSHADVTREAYELACLEDYLNWRWKSCVMTGRRWKAAIVTERR